MFAKLMSWLPGIIMGVIGIENAIGNRAPGTTKKALFMSVVTAATQAGEMIPDDHVKGISTTVDAVVSALNASGVFTTTK